MTYKHTQTGWLILMVCAVLAIVDVVLFALVFPKQPTGAPLGGVMMISSLGLIAVIALLFGSLSVEVSDVAIELRFGVGIIRKAFRLDEIKACKPVRNRWWWGWGIRLIPGGWLYNVSGLDAVELELRNGRFFRIGTDEPRQLAEFISAKLKRLA